MAEIADHITDVHHDANITIDDASVFAGPIEVVQLIRVNKGDHMTRQVVGRSVRTDGTQEPTIST